MKKSFHHRILSSQTLQTFLINLVVAFVYGITGKFGLSFASVNPSATVLWPPTGIALAALLLFGYRVIPGIFFAAFFVNLTTAGGVVTSLGIGMGNMLEGIVGAYLIKRFANGLHVLDTFSDIVKFTFLAAVVSTTVSATIGVATLVFGNLAMIHQIGSIWLTWWLGDMGGDLVIAPFVIAWIIYPFSINLKRILPFLISLFGLFIISEVVFHGILPYAYLCIPISVWIAFWFEQKGATLATIFVAIIATFYTLHGFGPFAHQRSTNESLLLLQLFLNIFSLTALTFSATIVTTRKSQKNLSSQEERFKALIEKSFEGVVLIDVTSKILYASPSVKNVLGYASDELIDMNGFDLVYPADRDRTIKTLASLVLKPNSTVTVEYRTIRKDKNIIWVQATGTNLLLDPNVHAVVVNFRDITDKKVAEQKIIQEMQEDEAMLSSIGDGIIATDDKKRITIINQAACEMLKWTEKDIIGKDIIDAIPMQDESENTIDEKSRPITKVLTHGKQIVTSPINYYVRKDKTRFPVRFILTPIILDKKVVGTIEVFHDITREKETDKAKNEFVSLASHQLRTPLATINWYIEGLMKNNLVKGKESSYLQEIYHASQRMINLINALLNTSRLDLGTFMVEPEKTNLVKITNQTIKDLLSQKEKEGIDIKKQYQKNMPLITADPKLLIIILQNLLSNAMKYSQKKGTIIVSLIYDKKGFLIEVADNGYGIPKNQQPKVFSKMFRADNARTIDPEGSGLGLYITKSIIDATGGKIWFESEEKKGTTFFVSFPSSGMHKKEGQKLLR